MVATVSANVQSNAALVPAGTLASLLMCPQCGGDVTFGGGAGLCAGCGTHYPVEDGIPVFAPAHTGSRFEPPAVYDAVQLALGGRRSIAGVAAHLVQPAPASVLDVGGGTGLYAAAVPPGARYVVVDTDPAKLRRLTKRVARAEAILADAANLPVRSGAVDVGLFVAVAHHLSDDALDAALAELARVARRRVLFVDPVAGERRAARLLWRLDRGSSPRPAEELVRRAERFFNLEHVERYSIWHDYLLWLGAPRAASVL